MTLDLDNITQVKFDALIARAKEENPNLYLFFS